MDLPVVQRHINRLTTGDPSRSWAEAIQETYFPPDRWGRRGLTLGCNDGRAERAVLSTGICSSFDAIDISEEAIAEAKRRAGELGLDVDYSVCDVNFVALPGETYGLVLTVASLHHFERLGHVLDQVHDALIPEGLFVFNEFVGPSRFRWREKQLELAQELLEMIPEELRRRGDESIYTHVARPDPVAFDRDEPFEAIRSEEILPLVEERFRILAHQGYGGSLLHLALQGIARNFVDGDAGHERLLERLCAEEQRLCAEHSIASDFAVVVAARREAG